MVPQRDSAAASKAVEAPAAPAEVPAPAGSDYGLLIQQLLDEKRQALERELGLSGRRSRHFRRSSPAPFTRTQRPRTTLLFQGLTPKHGRLIEAGLRGLGYRCADVPVESRSAFQLGKELGNPGQCSPAYYSVGSLVQYLQRLEERGLSRAEIIDQYVFFVAGSCGPCRFGMYEEEYRLALRNAGFEGFRVLLFQQQGGLRQSPEAAGLEVNADFLLAIAISAAVADLVNDMAHQIRPYEVDPGATDRAVEEAMALLTGALEEHCGGISGSSLGRLAGRAPLAADALTLIWKVLGHVRGRGLRGALARTAELLGEVEVDRTRIRPVVKLVGEFWAQITEGDGNHRMMSFLAEEGAEVYPETMAGWLPFILHQAKVRVRDRLGAGSGSRRQRLAHRARGLWTMARLTAVERLFAWEWSRLRRVLKGRPRPLPDQYELRSLGNPFYHYRCGGGEGHLEVAKNIYYQRQQLCHMVLSLKPFGCLPSTQSDAVQSAVTSRYPELLYLPIETSGEGEVNALSRVQMALGEAKERARDEVARALEQTGLTLAEVAAHARSHPELRRARYCLPHAPGAASVAAAFVAHVAERMQRRAADGAPTSKEAVCARA